MNRFAVFNDDEGGEEEEQVVRTIKPKKTKAKTKTEDEKSKGAYVLPKGSTIKSVLNAEQQKILNDKREKQRQEKENKRMKRQEEEAAARRCFFFSECKSERDGEWLYCAACYKKEGPCATKDCPFKTTLSGDLAGEYHPFCATCYSSRLLSARLATSKLK